MFTIAITSAAVYSVLIPVEKGTGLSLGALNAGTGYMVWSVLRPNSKSMLNGRSSYYLGGVACFGSLLHFNMGSDLYSSSH